VVDALFAGALAGIRRFEILDLKSIGVSISRQLRAWADSLQNSDIPGQRYLTNKVRRSAKEAQERKEFLEELRKIREGGSQNVRMRKGIPLL